MHNVKSGSTISARLEFYSIPVPECGCLIWTNAVNSTGYGRLWISGKRKLAHRLAWEVKNGPIPNKMEVLHRCDIPCCINADHLFLGTHKENMADSAAKGRANGGGPSGEKHWKTTFTADDILKIRSMKGTLKSISKQFGVTPQCIWRIKHRISWGHVPD